MKRYERQIAIQDIGVDGQKKLKNSSVLVIGAGGLGSPVLTYLCAAGVGRLGVVDSDTVDISNLNRQTLHKQADVGKKKAENAAKKLWALNPEVVVEAYDKRLDGKNVHAIFAGYDVVVDCVDNLSTRLLVSSVCKEIGTPLVEGGIEGFSGFVMSVVPGSACYGCLLNNPSRKERHDIPVLGATAGAVGSVQAAECIKLLLHIGAPLVNKLLLIDLFTQQFNTVDVKKNPQCSICKGE
ncbi:HesA/MoeB/ThiF family protein [Christensenellaceae bacterium OttesenSCG-928-M15]|nr:HesA/MoeB/ThiF family protein [Christensenellaceae bacterium OttesenSCG-928-M15]